MPSDSQRARQYPKSLPLTAAVCALGAAFLLILVAACTPAEQWPLYGVLLTVGFIATTLVGVPIVTLLKRLAVFGPVLALFSLSLPISQGFTAGWDIAVGIAARGLLTFLIVHALGGFLSFEDWLRVLRRLPLPALLVDLLALTYRYLFVFWQELNRMRTARRARGFGEVGLWQRWKISVQLIGMLLIRALTRAERVHNAMTARAMTGGAQQTMETPQTSSCHGSVSRAAVARGDTESLRET